MQEDAEEPEGQEEAEDSEEPEGAEGRSIRNSPYWRTRHAVSLQEDAFRFPF